MIKTIVYISKVFVHLVSVLSNCSVTVASFYEVRAVVVHMIMSKKLQKFPIKDYDSCTYQKEQMNRAMTNQ